MKLYRQKDLKPDDRYHLVFSSADKTLIRRERKVAKSQCSRRTARVFRMVDDVSDNFGFGYLSHVSTEQGPVFATDGTQAPP